ncbi:hypothetical protein [Inquilinus limosus]|uniref:hypothetical protein n=1 Tax=Inquilinus limosus TaxID=171674 RepID=UPI0011981D5C|nr:hypothetical protein [Inquilinus limosus]
MERSYDSLPGFEHLYLEDSFVLGLIEGEQDLQFSMEFVLTRDHPDYHPPHKNERHCYRSGYILFEGIKSKQWLRRVFKPFHDPSGQKDYGNIDAFLCGSSGYFLEGDWGELRIEADAVCARLDPMRV